MVRHTTSKDFFNDLASFAKICTVTLLTASPAYLSCSSAPQSQSHFVKVTEDRYGGEVECLSNESKSFLLCVNRPKVQPRNPQQPVRFVLFDVAQEVIVLEDSLGNGNVRWVSNDRIEVRTIPEVVSDDGDTGGGYIFDTHTRTRIPIPAQGKKD